MRPNLPALSLALTLSLAACGDDGTGPDPIDTPVSDVTMSTSTLVVGTGLTSALTATLTDAGGASLTGRAIAWTSRTPATATVTQTGAISALAAGSTWIVAESEGVRDSTLVTVVDGRIAFAWNDNPGTAGNSTPDPDYSYNISGLANNFTRGATGQYTVSWPGLTIPAGATNAHFVTAYAAPSGSYCAQQGWGESFLNYRCFDASGAPANLYATVVAIGSGTLSGRSAFGWVSSAGASAEASSGYRHHPLGRSIFSERLAIGSYVVRFAGLQRAAAGDREGVIVNAYGTAGHVCQPGAPTSTATGLEVAVRCFDATGAPTDTPYTILLVDGARPGAKLGFALADQPTVASYAPANSAVRGTGSVQIQREALGTWLVGFTGFTRSGDLKESFLVSPVGATPGRCWIDVWGSSTTPGGTSNVRVSCSTVTGAPADIPFSIVAVQ
jgi:hypothetical protein